MFKLEKVTEMIRLLTATPNPKASFLITRLLLCSPMTELQWRISA